MVFRWIQLSDLHYYTNPKDNTDNDRLEDKVIDRLKKTNKSDCVVITGDICVKGKITNEEKLKEFVSKACKASLKEDLLPSVREHVFICPGNHDLCREYSDLQGKSIVTRNSALNSAVSKSPDSFISSKEADYELLAKKAFQPFYDFAKEISTSGESQYDGEYRIFNANNDTRNKGPVFIGINTALYAGQIREREQIIDDIVEKKKELKEIEDHYYTIKNQEGLSKIDENKPVRLYKDIVGLSKELEGVVANDEHKLCYVSKEAYEALKERMDNSEEKPLVVFFGHHPIEWMTEIAQKTISNQIDSYPLKLYMCGHIHRPSGERIEIKFSGTNSAKLVEVASGGLFPDQQQFSQTAFIQYTLDTIKRKLTVEYNCYIDRKKVFSIVPHDVDEFEWKTFTFSHSYSDKSKMKRKRDEVNVDSIVKQGRDSSDVQKISAELDSYNNARIPQDADVDNNMIPKKEGEDFGSRSSHSYNNIFGRKKRYRQDVPRISMDD